MNSFGRIFRVHIFGESHGPFVGITIDGCPAGIAISEDDFSADMQRRQGGNAAGTTPRKEADVPQIISGVFNGFSTGTPVTILFANGNTRSADYEQQRSIPRPGHADFVAHKKFGGFEDYRGGGHFSGRLTACLVAVGVIAKKLLPGVSVHAKLVELGGEQDIEKGLQQALEANDSVGGIVECRAQNLPIGLGEPFWDSVESLMAHAVFAIPAIKGIEFGAGFGAARMRGSTHNDAIADDSGRTRTNHAGGINGGLTNGNELIFQVAVKPTSSTPQPQQSLNITTGLQEDFTVKGRHDLSIALRVPVVVEAAAAMVLADLLLIQKSLSSTSTRQ